MINPSIARRKGSQLLADAVEPKTMLVAKKYNLSAMNPKAPVFFGLPPTDDNPIAFVVIKANFSTHEGEYIPFVWCYRPRLIGYCGR